MNQQSLFLLPLAGMVFLTFSIMVWMLKLRYRAVLKDGLNPKYFKLYKGARIPEYLDKVTQHYENLLELPIFFYLGVTLILVLDLIDTFYIVLAWGFFLSRLVHSFIHTTSNKLVYRKNVFILSTLILILMWLRIMIGLF